jgi:hypothetical protein
MNHLINGLARLAVMNSKVSNLNKGQMIRGKVVNVEKDNQALVIVDQAQVKARVTPPVAKGGSYLFQVERIDPTIELKVIHHPSSGMKGKDLSSLLKQFGVETSKTNRTFLKQAFDLDIPLRKKEMTHAFQLLKNSENKPLSREVLLFMLKRRMPVKPAIYQALVTKYSTSFSQILSEFQKDLNHTPGRTNDRIRSMVQLMQGERTTSTEQQITLRLDRDLILDNNFCLFELFKQAKIIDKTETFSTFQKNWCVERENGNQTSLNKANSPVPIAKVATLLKDLFQKQVPLTLTDRQSLHQWLFTSEKVINHPKTNNNEVAMGSLSNRVRSQWTTQFNNLLSRNVFSKIFHHLEEDAKSMIRELSEKLNNPGKNNMITNLPKNNLQSLLHKVRTLIQQQVPSDQIRVLIDWLNCTSNLVSIPEKDRILTNSKP